jgi:hypothetical protein
MKHIFSLILASLCFAPAFADTFMCQGEGIPKQVITLPGNAIYLENHIGLEIGVDLVNSGGSKISSGGSEAERKYLLIMVKSL